MSLSIIKAWQNVHLICSSKAEQTKCMLLAGCMLSTTWFWWSGWSGDAIFSELLATRLRTLTRHRCSITSVWTSDTKFESFALVGSFEPFVSKNEFKVIRAQSALWIGSVDLKRFVSKERFVHIARPTSCYRFDRHISKHGSRNAAYLVSILVIRCETNSDNIMRNVRYEDLDTKITTKKKVWRLDYELWTLTVTMAELIACKVCNSRREKYYGLAVTSLDQLKIKGGFEKCEIYYSTP